MKLKDIAKAANGELVKGDSDAEVGGFSIDSRTLIAGDLFIAIKGNRFDGHNFIKDAFNKGAVAVLVSSLSPAVYELSPGVIRVSDTTAALGDLARYKRLASGAKVIAVTGSNGKTTTKDMIASILTRNSFKVLFTKENENNNIGLPLTLLRLKDEKFCSLEIGMNHLGEIDYLSGVARPDIGIITNIGPCHLEHLRSIENVLKAKLELLNYMDKNGVLVVNGDDPNLSELKNISQRIIKFGLNDNNDYRASSLGHKDGCWTFSLNNKYEVMLGSLGRHNIYNGLAAIAAAELCGVRNEAIFGALKDFKLPHNRLELKEIAGIKIIDDTYNSNPNSLMCAMEALSSYANGRRKVLVSGDMLELGDMSGYFHEAIADMAGAAGIDVLITVGKNSHLTYIAAQKKGMHKEALWHFNSSREAGEFLKNIVKEGDLVLVKGSRAMMMEDAIKCFTTSYIR